MKEQFYDNQKTYEDPITKFKFNTQFDYVEEGVEIPIFYSETYTNDSTMSFNFIRGFDDFYLVKTKYNAINGSFISDSTNNNTKCRFDFSNDEDKKCLDERILQLKNALKNFIPKSNLNICYLAIPTSKKFPIINIPQYICDKIKQTDQDVEFTRIEEKEASHLGESRDSKFEDIVKGLELNDNKNKNWFNEYDVILLIDDIVTTATSFREINRYLIDKIGVPKEKLVNFAFYKYQKVDNWEKIKKLSKEKTIIKDSNIDGIIWDFDQTIVDSRKRNKKFEDSIFDLVNRNIQEKCTLEYDVYENLNDVFNYISDKIPYCITSNRPNFVNKYLSFPKIHTNIFPQRRIDLFNKSFYYYYAEKDDISKFNCKLLVRKKGEECYKPSSDLINKSIELLKEKTNTPAKRIIGIGNTKNDIIAYKAAGIEAVLVTWGIKYYYNDYGADYVFKTPIELLEFIKENYERN